MVSSRRQTSAILALRSHGRIAATAESHRQGFHGAGIRQAEMDGVFLELVFDGGRPMAVAAARRRALCAATDWTGDLPWAVLCDFANCLTSDVGAAAADRRAVSPTRPSSVE